jgi:hypothetical protein
MRGHSHKVVTMVTLIPPSREKDLTQAFLITLRTQRDTSSVGEVPHSVRDDQRSTQHGTLFTPYA